MLPVNEIGAPKRSVPSKLPVAPPAVEAAAVGAVVAAAAGAVVAAGAGAAVVGFVAGAVVGAEGALVGAEVLAGALHAAAATAKQQISRRTTFVDISPQCLMSIL